MGERQTVEVYGASDDLIEVDGDLCDEFDGGYTPRYLHFSEGTVLKVQYSPVEDNIYYGLWKIERVKEGTAEYAHAAATDPEDDYSDRVTLTGEGLLPMQCWKSFEGASRYDLLDIIGRFEFSGLSDDQLKAIHAIVTERA